MKENGASVLKREMTLQEVQQASLEVLKEIDSICLKYGFHYWIAYGTLLGAVRHGGFIPWDDDVDIVMPRKDYEAFISYVQSSAYTNPSYELHTSLNNEAYPFYISRFCDKSHELLFDDSEYKSGCFVDIYPYDGMGKLEDKAYWKEKEPAIKEAQKRLTMSAHRKGLYGSSLLHKIGNLPQLTICRLKGKDYAYNQLDAYRNKFTWEESEYVGLVCWSTGTYPFRKEWFEELIRMPFEDVEVNAPKGYIPYLEANYGDYMKLPPEEKRKPYHQYTAYINEQE